METFVNNRSIISIFSQNLFLSKDLMPKFRLLVKISIYCQNFDFCPNFHLCPNFYFCKKNFHTAVRIWRLCSLHPMDLREHDAKKRFPVAGPSSEN